MRIGLLFVFMMAMLSCKTYSLPSEAQKRLELSEGGGFTGAVTTWVLLPNGQLFQKNTFDTAWQSLPSIKPAAAKRHIKEVENLLLKENILQPDNMYRSFHLITKDTTVYSQWPMLEGKTPVYDSLFTKITSLFKPNGEIHK